MKIEFAGKYQWNGLYIDKGGEKNEFVVFADTFEDAVKNTERDMGTVVALWCGDHIGDQSFEVPDDSPGIKALQAAHKRSIN